MEKIESLNKKQNVKSLLTSKNAKLVIGTILFSAIGVALPRIFHVLVGSSAGATFLPMHIAVLIAALTLGITSGSIVAGVSVICNYLLTGMPAIARLPYMIIELVIYAILLGIFNKRCNSFVSLIITMVVGRILYGTVLFTATNVFGFSAYGISVMESLKMGIPGLIIQIICVPIIAKIINERLKLND